jgi:hypothetical protein
VATLVILDDDGEEVRLDEDDAATLLALTGELEAATVSSCPGCRSRVLACVAVVDLLDAAPPHPQVAELRALAEDAPTLHLYVEDLAAACRHSRWRDPGYGEWAHVLDELEDDRGEQRE